MSPLAILAIINRALELAGVAGATAAMIRGRVEGVIEDAEERSGKRIGDMADTELVQLIEHPTKTPEELLGKVDDGST